MSIRKYKLSIEIEMPDDMHEEDVIEILHDEIKQATGCHAIGDFEAIKPLDEADIMDTLLKHGDLLTCYNCGKKLTEVNGKKLNKRAKDMVIAKLVLDPGESNYPHEPDVPATLYFVCSECEKS